jgi:hypothetical protein
VKQSGIGSRALLSAQLMLIVLFCGSGCNSTSSAQTQLATSSINSARAPELSSEGQTWLRTAISSGSFPDLRWPDFSDYGPHVKKFYELNGNSLWWVKGMEPTPPARQVIALMLQADQKGSPQTTMTAPDGIIGWPHSNLLRRSRSKRML